MYVCIFRTATYVIPHSTIPFPQSSLYIEPCGLKWKEFSDLKLCYHLNNRGTNWREQKWEQLRNQNHSIVSKGNNTAKTTNNKQLVTQWLCPLNGIHKSISSSAQYVPLQKYFSHPSLVIYLFPTPSIKLKLGLQKGWRLLIAKHMDQSLWFANQKLRSYLLLFFGRC